MTVYDVFIADCPARTTLALVTGKWSVVAVVALGSGPARYSQLQARIGGISNKMLTQTLHDLEDSGLVRRERPLHRLRADSTGRRLTGAPVALSRRR